MITGTDGRSIMSFYPSLPDGYGHQTAWAPERNGTKWELHRVYDRDGRLERSRCFWIVYPLFAREFPPPRRVVTWADVPGVRFAAFTRATTSLEQVERWIDRANASRRGAHRAARAGELQAA
jgi:hypothetical protein